MFRFVSVTLWFKLIVASFFMLPYVVVVPYETTLSAGWSVVQVIAAAVEVIRLTSIALIVGGLTV